MGGGAPKVVNERADRFERNLESYRAASYKEAHVPQVKTQLEREIKYTDDQIDQLVYELYGLTEEEIKIVEEATER